MSELSEETLHWYKTLLKKFPEPHDIKNATEANVRCTNPDHHDLHPSLGVDLGVNGHGPQVLLNCRSRSCDLGAILRGAELRVEDLYFEQQDGHHGHRGEQGDRHEDHDTDLVGSLPGCTLEQYAEAKDLPLEFLQHEDVGLEDAKCYCSVKKKEVPAVSIPYCDRDEQEVSTRYRTGLLKASSGPDTRFRWEKGDHPMLYGLHRLHEAIAAGFVLLCEGESDVQVAWYHGRPAVGVPGAKNWKDEWAEELDEVPLIIVPVEPDDAGEELWAALSGCERLRGRLRRVDLD